MPKYAKCNIAKMRKPKLNPITNGFRWLWRCVQFSVHAVANTHASNISAIFLRIVYSAYVAKPSVSKTADKLTLMPCNNDDMIYVNKMALKIPCDRNCIKTSGKRKGKTNQNQNQNQLYTTKNALTCFKPIMHG